MDPNRLDFIVKKDRRTSAYGEAAATFPLYYGNACKTAAVCPILAITHEQTGLIYGVKVLFSVR